MPRPSKWFGPSADVPSVLFRVDAGRAHGMGHLQRCLSLAAALRREGVRSIFGTGPDPAVQRRLAAYGMEGIVVESAVGTEADAYSTVSLARSHAAATVIIDSYGNRAQYMRWLRKVGLIVVAIDDLARGVFPCDLVVNGAAHATHLRYAVDVDVTLLLGARYAMLRPEFWARRRRRKPSARPRLLVAVGAADPLGLLPAVVAALRPLPSRVCLDVVVGPFAGNPRAIERARNLGAHEVEIHESPTAVRRLMEHATLAISAAGQTLYELACVGCPTIALETTHNQRPQLKALSEAGVVEPIWHVSHEVLRRRLAGRVQGLLDDRVRQRRMAAAGRALVDGIGARRVARVVTALVRGG